MLKNIRQYVALGLILSLLILVLVAETEVSNDLWYLIPLLGLIVFSIWSALILIRPAAKKTLNSKLDHSIRNVIDMLWKEQERIFELFQQRNELYTPYFIIKNQFLDGDILNNENFQMVYRKFYTMNTAGLMPEHFKRYFELLEYKETDLGKILRELYEIRNLKGYQSLQFVFATKLLHTVLHTVNNDLPIYDSHIGGIFGLSPKPNNYINLDERIKDRVYIYDNLKGIYKEILKIKKVKNIIQRCRQRFNWHNNDISDTKVLDFLLWGIVKVNLTPLPNPLPQGEREI